MWEMPLKYILPKFINNTIYQSDLVLPIIQIAMNVASVKVDRIPLTVISSFHNVPGKLGYYYTPNQLQQDWVGGKFMMGLEKFERAKYGIVRLKLNFEITAKQFLTAAIHEYVYAVQYEAGPEVMREDSMIVEVKDRLAYDLSKKLTRKVCCEDWVVAVIENLDKALNWI